MSTWSFGYQKLHLAKAVSQPHRSMEAVKGRTSFVCIHVWMCVYVWLWPCVCTCVRSYSYPFMYMRGHMSMHNVFAFMPMYVCVSMSMNLSASLCLSVCMSFSKYMPAYMYLCQCPRVHAFTYMCRKILRACIHVYIRMHMCTQL